MNVDEVTKKHDLEFVDLKLFIDLVLYTVTNS